jgi:hypothetical protein
MNRTIRMLLGALGTEVIASLVDSVGDSVVRDLYARLLSRLVDMQAANEQAAKVQQ